MGNDDDNQNADELGDGKDGDPMYTASPEPGSNLSMSPATASRLVFPCRTTSPHFHLCSGEC